MRGGGSCWGKAERCGGAAWLYAEVAGGGVGEALGGEGTGGDTGVEGLEGSKHGAINASLTEALPQEVAGDRIEGFTAAHV